MREVRQRGEISGHVGQRELRQGDRGLKMDAICSELSGEVVNAPMMIEHDMGARREQGLLNVAQGWMSRHPSASPQL
jgi:hypothetical protein